VEPSPEPAVSFETKGFVSVSFGGSVVSFKVTPVESVESEELGVASLSAVEFKADGSSVEFIGGLVSSVSLGPPASFADSGSSGEVAFTISEELLGFPSDNELEPAVELVPVEELEPASSVEFPLRGGTTSFIVSLAPLVSLVISGSSGLTPPSVSFITAVEFEELASVEELDVSLAFYVSSVPPLFVVL